jgi:hypothetical protein
MRDFAQFVDVAPAVDGADFGGGQAGALLEQVAAGGMLTASPTRGAPLAGRPA